MLSATDMFCGAGGSTTGATLAGVEVKLAINHWKRAIETHNTNYPNTTHVLTDLHKANPDRFYGTDILIASPECTSHTLAKGKKRTNQGQLLLPGCGLPDLDAEAEERSRCTMWTPLDWAERWDYKAVVLENVVDAHLWRPFDAWLQAWKSLDYDFQIVYLNSMHVHPTPQSRDRMYFVAWKRKNPRPDLAITPLAYCTKCGKDVNAVQCWKKPTRKFGKYNQQYTYGCPVCAMTVTPYYYAAANAIDWSLSAPRIGDRKRPLRPKTVKRIEYGLQKFAGGQVLVLSTSHSSGKHVSYILEAEKNALPTQTTRQDMAITIPPFLMDHLAEYRPRAITGPTSTICASGNHHSLVVPSACLMSYYGNGQMTPVGQAVPTVTTLERHALVTSSSTIPDVSDCGFRMLTPSEIQAAMAFPKEYILTGSHKEKVKQLGNAVTPPVMRLLMQRVVDSLS